MLQKSRGHWRLRQANSNFTEADSDLPYLRSFSQIALSEVQTSPTAVHSCPVMALAGNASHTHGVQTHASHVRAFSACSRAATTICAGKGTTK